MMHVYSELFDKTKPCPKNDRRIIRLNFNYAIDLNLALNQKIKIIVNKIKKSWDLESNNICDISVTKLSFQYFFSVNQSFVTGKKK